MGSLVKCTLCELRCGTRPVSVYWRWQRADGLWKKYRARICIGCYESSVAPLVTLSEVDGRLHCPSCGMDTEDDYDAVSFNAFPAKEDMVSGDAPFCGACAAQYRVPIAERAVDISDVDGAPGAPSTAPSAGTVINALGRLDFGASRVR